MTSCWRQLGCDKSNEAIFEYLLDQNDRSLPYDEVLKKKGKPKHGSSKTATTSSLAVSCKLHCASLSFNFISDMILPLSKFSAWEKIRNVNVLLKLNSIL